MAKKVTQRRTRMPQNEKNEKNNLQVVKRSKTPYNANMEHTEASQLPIREIMRHIVLASYGFYDTRT